MQQIERGDGFGRILARAAQRRRLRDGHAALERIALHGARLQLHPAAGGTIRLRQYERDGKTGLMDRGERRRREFRRAGKNDAQ